MRSTHFAHRVVNITILVTIALIGFLSFSNVMSNSPEKTSLLPFSPPNAAVPTFGVNVISIDDDMNFPSEGNGDNQIDAGETIQLRLQIQNLGTGQPESLRQWCMLLRGPVNTCWSPRPQ